MKKSIRIIKKYPNRRLYDTELGSYITLEAIKKLIYDHQEFKIVESKTRQDVTKHTLLQIILDQEMLEKPIFNNDLLQDLIRTYQGRTKTLFNQYLQEMTAWLQQQKTFTEQLASFKPFDFEPENPRKPSKIKQKSTKKLKNKSLI